MRGFTPQVSCSLCVLPILLLAIARTKSLSQNHLGNWGSITVKTKLILHNLFHRIQIVAMFPETIFPQCTVEQLVHQIFVRRRISRMDQHLLMSLLLSKNALDPQDRNSIDRVFYALKTGSLQVVD